jgi:hypothetical protein
LISDATKVRVGGGLGGSRVQDDLAGGPVRRDRDRLGSCTSRRLGVVDRHLARGEHVSAVDDEASEEQ